MIRFCKHCESFHVLDALALTTPVGRFMMDGRGGWTIRPGGPLGFRAKVEGAPVRDSREEAVRDYCELRKAAKIRRNTND